MSAGFPRDEKRVAQIETEKRDTSQRKRSEPTSRAAIEEAIRDFKRRLPMMELTSLRKWQTVHAERLSDAIRQSRMASAMLDDVNAELERRRGAL